MCCIHFSDANILPSVDNTTAWALLQSPAVLSFSHYGVSSNVTHLICAWQIYPYMMFALYAGMLKKKKPCMWPWKTRVSSNAENVKFKRAHPRVWQPHTVVGDTLESTITPEPCVCTCGERCSVCFTDDIYPSINHQGWNTSTLPALQRSCAVHKCNKGQDMVKKNVAELHSSACTFCPNLSLI